MPEGVIAACYLVAAVLFIHRRAIPVLGQRIFGARMGGTALERAVPGRHA